MEKTYEQTWQRPRNYIGMITLSPDIWIIISAIAQLERDLIAERVKNGLANAKAKGKQIGRVRKRNSVLIESLLDAGLSYREISRIAKCSHGSVGAQRKEWVAKKEAERKRKELEEEQKKIKFEDSIELPPDVAARIDAAKAAQVNELPVEPVPE